MNPVDEALTRGVEKVYPSREALAKVLRSNKKIKLYQGFDPSMANLHLGNLVGILKLRQFQALGHEVIFLVGDFTGMIGDPTDRSSSRKLLTRKEVLANSATWKKQAGKILNFRGKNPAKILYNSQWGDKVSFKDLIDITSHFTVQQLLERDFFQRRLKANKPIYLHEFLYPVAQAIDCVAMDVDLEIGGADQTFNMLAGRTLMKALKSKEKFVLTTKLLVDAKGEKAGKTAGNALFLNASPEAMYGGIMSFPDETILPGFELLTQLPMKSVQVMKGKPMELKKQLAWEIVKMLHGGKNAKNAAKEFERVFQKKDQPLTIPVIEIEEKEILLPKLLSQKGLVSSASVAKRLINQGGVDIDGKTVRNQSKPIKIKNGMVIRCGKKKFVKVKSRNS
jgi:tyrosyl-tRNA synthetase